MKSGILLAVPTCEYVRSRIDIALVVDIRFVLLAVKVSQALCVSST